MIMKTALLTVILFCILAVWGEANAQMRYAVVTSSDDIVIIENPLDRSLKIGDKFYVLRRKGLQEIALAIVKVERFKGNYCRLRMTERIINDQPGEGDYLIDYDPTRYTPWGEGFEQESQAPPTPRPEYSSTFTAEPNASKTRLMFTLFTGFGLSNFDAEELYGPNTSISQAGYWPLGAQFLVGLNILQIGAEFNYAVVPFTFETKTSNGQVAWEDKLNQVQFGALVRVNLVKGPVMPFLRAGSGMYTGNGKREYSAAIKEEYLNLTGEKLANETIELDTNFGFNFGAGVAIRNGFLEFVYHLVERSQDVTTIDASGNSVTQKERIKANNWEFQVGEQIPLH
jgi:hypothetical protein